MLALGLAICSGPALSVEYVLQPIVTAGALANDNLQLRVDDEEDAQALTLAPEITLTARNPNWSVAAAARAQRHWYDDSDFDRTNESFSLDGAYAGQTWLANLELRYDKYSFITVDDLDVDANIVSSERSRRTQSIVPSFTYSITERTGTRLSAGYEKQTVDQTDIQQRGGRLTDFDERNVRAELFHQLTPRARLFTEIRYSTVDFKDIDSESDTISLIGGSDYNFSETLFARAFIGVRRTDSEFLAQRQIFPGLPFFETFKDDEQQNGGVASISLERTVERLQLGAELSRSADASVEGDIIESDNFELTSRYRLTELLDLRLRAQAFRNRNKDNDASRSNRDLYRVTPTLRWNVSRDWAVDLSYTYTRIKRLEVAADEPADSNQVSVNIVYNFPRYAFSR